MVHTGCLKKNFLLPNLAFANIAVDGEKSSFIIFINNIILTVTVWCLVGYILDKFSLLKLYTSVSKLHYTITYMMITAPHYFSKCPPLAAMHFTALAFMSNIALLTITGPICATSFVMLACSSLKLEWRGLYTLDSRYSQRQKHLITFHKIPLTSQVSLFQSIHFMKMADVGFDFITVFLV